MAVVAKIVSIIEVPRLMDSNGFMRILQIILMEQEVVHPNRSFLRT